MTKLNALAKQKLKKKQSETHQRKQNEKTSPRQNPQSDSANDYESAVELILFTPPTPVEEKPNSPAHPTEPTAVSKTADVQESKQESKHESEQDDQPKAVPVATEEAQSKPVKSAPPVGEAPAPAEDDNQEEPPEPAEDDNQEEPPASAEDDNQEEPSAPAEDGNKEEPPAPVEDDNQELVQAASPEQSPSSLPKDPVKTEKSDSGSTLVTHQQHKPQQQHESRFSHDSVHEGKTENKPGHISTQHENWEHTKKALRQHYGGQEEPSAAVARTQKDPHEVVAAIMKRIHDSRLGEDHHLVIEPEESFTTSADGVLRISDVMTTRTICVIDSTTVEQLAGLFNKRQIMAAPIVDYQSQRYLGLVSMSDIFSYTFSQKILSTVQDGALVEDDSMGALDQPVRDFMETEQNVEVALDCTVQEACALMVKNHMHHLVVTRNHKVKGIFSSFDALKILASQPVAKA